MDCALRHNGPAIPPNTASECGFIMNIKLGTELYL